MADEVLRCWQCGQMASELVHDVDLDISVPLCLDCQSGWTEMVAMLEVFTDGMQRTIRLLTGRDEEA